MRRGKRDNGRKLRLGGGRWNDGFLLRGTIMNFIARWNRFPPLAYHRDVSNPKSNLFLLF
jgi:hypothetical protein